MQWTAFLSSVKPCSRSKEVPFLKEEFKKIKCHKTKMYAVTTCLVHAEEPGSCSNTKRFFRVYQSQRKCSRNPLELCRVCFKRDFHVLSDRNLNKLLIPEPNWSWFLMAPGYLLLEILLSHYPFSEKIPIEMSFYWCILYPGVSGVWDQAWACLPMVLDVSTQLLLVQNLLWGLFVSKHSIRLILKNW